MRRLALLLGLSLMLLPAAAVAQTVYIDFQPDNIIGNGEEGPGLGNWTLTGTDLSGNSGSYADIEVTSTASAGEDLSGSVWSWDSATGTITISAGYDGSYCSTATCFSGTFVSSFPTSGITGITGVTNSVTGTLDPGLAGYLNAPSGTYAGTFYVSLDPGCASGPCTSGTWQSADLNLAPVPEPGTLTLLGTGLLGLAGIVRRKLKK